MKKTVAKDVEAYISGASKESQTLLKEMRKLITSTLPKASESISYGVPFYKFDGEHVGFAAFKKHMTFGFGTDALSSEDREALEKKGYVLGKGTIQIRFDQKIPTTMIKKLLKYRAQKGQKFKARSV